LPWLTPEVLQGGAWSLVGVFVLAILTGRLVPRSTSKSLVDQANRTADAWQRAYEKQAALADLATRQSDQVMSEFETIEALIQSIVPPREKR